MAKIRSLLKPKPRHTATGECLQPELCNAIFINRAADNATVTIMKGSK